MRVVYSMTFLALVACNGDGGGSSTVDLYAWGEEAPYEGFPNSELSFADGWALSFAHSVDYFGKVELADPSSEEVVGSDETIYVADWVNTIDPAEVSSIDVHEGQYKFSYSIVPATSDATPVSEVDDAVLSTMVENGWNTYLEGTATKGDVSVTFKWGMKNAAHYKYCVNGEDDTDGVTTTAGKSTDATMFVHQDHTYWDRLGTEEANLRFDAEAAWVDESGEIPFDDLSGATIAALEGRDGKPILDENGGQLSYDDAGLGLGNLEAFIVYSTAQKAHLNGEGLCTTENL
jgi:hypothetical protein